MELDLTSFIGAPIFMPAHGKEKDHQRLTDKGVSISLSADLSALPCLMCRLGSNCQTTTGQHET